MIVRLAYVCRSTWKFAGGSIVARMQVSFMGRVWCDFSHLPPSAAVTRDGSIALKLSDDMVRFKIDNLPQGIRNADMFLAITDSFLETDVRDGENAGRHLQHTGVVRSLSSVGHLDTKKVTAYTADAKINVNPQWRGSNINVVLFVQDRATRKIVGATSLHL